MSVLMHNYELPYTVRVTVDNNGDIKSQNISYDEMHISRTNPVDEKFEERLVELLGVSALMKDELSPYDIAKMFYRAGYRDGDNHGFTMGRRNGQ